MIVHKAYKTALDPNDATATLMRKHGGTARYAYNWALGRIDERISEPNAIKLHKEWNVWKKENLDWWKEVSKCPAHQAFIDLANGFALWFNYLRKSAANMPAREVGRPVFKKKSMFSCNFSIGGGTKENGSVIVEEDRVRLPRIGWIRLPERGYIPVGRYDVAHVSQEAGRWFISIPVQIEEPDPIQPDGPVLGIDLGVKTHAICSDGTQFENPKALEKNLAELAELQARKDRQVQGSKRRKKTQKRICKKHWRIANIRRDAAHKTSAAVVKTKPSLIVLEGMSVADMLAESTDHGKNRRNADAAMGQLRIFIEYKAKWAGIPCVRADRYFPSTQRCSACGHIKQGEDKLKLWDRTYICEKCGCVHDRDQNAAENLRQYGECGWTSESWKTENEKLYTASSAGCARRSEQECLTKREPDIITAMSNYV